METAIFLARLFGIYFIMAGLSLLFKRQMLIREIKRLKESGAVYFFGLSAFLAGLAMVLAHNVWQGEWWRIAITLIGWAAFLKGIFLIFFPENLLTGEQSLSEKLLRNKLFFVLIGIAAVVLGICLSCAAF